MKQDIIEIHHNQDGKAILYARFERLHEDEYERGQRKEIAIYQSV